MLSAPRSRAATASSRRAPTAIFLASTLALFAALPLGAHVILDAPNGGETLTAGDSVVVRWRVALQHNTENWDLWYSVTGPDGPWIPVAVDLPTGDPTEGSRHSFTWDVPEDPSDRVRVRVRQDNVGGDFEDVSNDDLTIEALTDRLFADGFESGDVGVWFLVETP